MSDWENDEVIQFHIQKVKGQVCFDIIMSWTDTQYLFVKFLSRPDINYSSLESWWRWFIYNSRP